MWVRERLPFSVVAYGTDQENGLPEEPLLVDQWGKNKKQKKKLDPTLGPAFEAYKPTPGPA